MSGMVSAQLQDRLEDQVRARTGRRIRNLAVELSAQGVVLRGQVSSYYVKQLAQHGIREVVPDLHLENSIVVEKRPGLALALDGF